MKKIYVFTVISLLLVNTNIITATKNPETLTLSIQNDGTTHIQIIYETNITDIQKNITLIGQQPLNLLIFNEDNLPLPFTQIENIIQVDSYGSEQINITYITAELTGKENIIWSFNISTPISSEINLPIGATILYLNNVPLEIDLSSESTTIIMPSGQVVIQYTLFIEDSETLAEETIKSAESIIQQALSENIIVTEAQTLLSEAKNLFQESRFIEAEAKASEAILLVEQISIYKIQAEAKISSAESAISSARENGRTEGLADSEDLLDKALEEYDNGEYTNAINLADEAINSALDASQKNYSQYYYLITLISLIFIGIIRIQKKKNIDQKTKQRVEFDLDFLFQENPELSLEDREVLRYISENDGAVFAYDIRERFDIPRTSAWRMIQRFIRYDIIDEKKIGGQSFIEIKPRYRRSIG